MSKSYWLLKTEPSTYAFGQLVKDKKTNWNGVRNYQARNYLKLLSSGDEALIYHSGDEKAVVGLARVIAGAYPDRDLKKPGDWVQVDLKPIRLLKLPVSLAAIKSHPELREIPLIKQSRLSVMPLSENQYRVILNLGGLKK